jgi:hypothetical protein
MARTFTGIFELFDTHVERNHNGNRLVYFFEIAEDVEIEKKLIYFREENVKAHIKRQVELPNKKDNVEIDDVFECLGSKWRRLKKGNKLRLVLKQAYDKDKELDAVKLRFDNCQLDLEITQEGLDFGEEPEEEGEGEL